MHVVIFGRTSCPCCVRATQLSEKLKERLSGFSYRYVDIHSEGISKESLEKTIGKPIETIPQIFVNKTHVGGFNDYKNYIDKIDPPQN